MAFNRSSQRQNVAIILSSMSFLLWGVKWVFPLNLEEEAHGFNKWQLGLSNSFETLRWRSLILRALHDRQKSPRRWASRLARGWGRVQWPPQPRGCILHGTVAQ